MKVEWTPRPNNDGWDASIKGHRFTIHFTRLHGWNFNAWDETGHKHLYHRGYDDFVEATQFGVLDFSTHQLRERMHL